MKLRITILKYHKFVVFITNITTNHALTYTNNYTHLNYLVEIMPLLVTSLCRSSVPLKVVAVLHRSPPQHFMQSVNCCGLLSGFPQPPGRP